MNDRKRRQAFTSRTDPRKTLCFCVLQPQAARLDWNNNNVGISLVPLFALAQTVTPSQPWKWTFFLNNGHLSASATVCSRASYTILLPQNIKAVMGYHANPPRKKLSHPTPLQNDSSQKICKPLADAHYLRATWNEGRGRSGPRALSLTPVLWMIYSTLQSKCPFSIVMQ